MTYTSLTSGWVNDFCDTSKFSNLLAIAQLTVANGLSTVDNFLGWYFATKVAITFMCSGVVPQHPPSILTKPSFKNSSTCAPICSGVSSY